MIATIDPREASMATHWAATVVCLPSCRINRTRGSARASSARSSRLPSVLPSSTTIASHRGNGAARNRANTSGRLGRSFRTARTTVSSGAVGVPRASTRSAIGGGPAARAD